MQNLRDTQQQPQRKAHSPKALQNKQKARLINDFQPNGAPPAAEAPTVEDLERKLAELEAQLETARAVDWNPLFLSAQQEQGIEHMVNIKNLDRARRIHYSRVQQKISEAKHNELKELRSEYDAATRELERDYIALCVMLARQKAQEASKSSEYTNQIKAWKLLRNRRETLLRRKDALEVRLAQSRANQAQIPVVFPPPPFGPSDPSAPTTQPEADEGRLSLEHLRVHLPHFTFKIDSHLTIDFTAAPTELKIQLSQIRDRLAAFFPRLDALPTGFQPDSNKNRDLNTRAMYKTYLKVMVGRYREKTGVLGERAEGLRINAVMDGWARKRMAERWNQLFAARKGYWMTAEELERQEALAFVQAQQLAKEQAAEKEQETFQTYRHKYSELIQEAWSGEDKYGPRRSKKDLAARAKQLELSEENPQETLHSSSSPPRSTRQQNTTIHTATPRPHTTPPSPSPSEKRAFSTTPPHLSKPNNNTNDTTTTTTTPTPQPTLPHLTPHGTAHMVPITHKPHTARTATAVGSVYFSNSVPLSLIRTNSLKKGDVLSVSRIAGIMAAKKCPEIVPLCHPILLSHVGVEVKVFGAEEGSEIGHEDRDRGADDLQHGGVAIECTVQCSGSTGVEMEALTAVMGTALSVVDMCKAVDKFQRIGDVRVVLKEGGKSGTWREEGWTSWQEK